MFGEAVSAAHPLQMEGFGPLVTDKSEENQDKRGGGGSWGRGVRGGQDRYVPWGRNLGLSVQLGGMEAVRCSWGPGWHKQPIPSLGRWSWDDQVSQPRPRQSPTAGQLVRRAPCLHLGLEGSQ